MSRLNERTTTADLYGRCRRGRTPILSAFLAAILGLATPAAVLHAQRSKLPPEEEQFINCLISELRYYETAERYLKQLKKEYRGSDLATLWWYHADTLKPRVSEDEYLKFIEDVRRKFPNHPRSTLGSLPKISLKMDGVVALFGKAKDSAAPEKRTAFRKEARRAFKDEVQAPLDALVENIGKRLNTAEKQARGKRPEPESLVSLRRNRNLVEFARVKIYLIYGRLLKETGKYNKSSKKILQRGLELAESFVEDRYEFPLMQYEAQLQKGLLQFELKRYGDAVEDLDPLLGLRPLERRGGYSKELVDRFKDFQIQSILFSAKALNADGKFQKAAQLVNSKMLLSTDKTWGLATAESSPKLQKYFVLSLLERAVGLAGSGQADRGMRLINRIIKKYEKAADQDLIAQAYIVDARKALGTTAEVGGIMLSALAYFQAGMGLYAELKEEEALALFQHGLTSTNSSKEERQVAPLCLDKIGEINYRLERYAESAMAYLEICERFPRHKIATKVAKNALSATTKLLQKESGHAGYRKLDDLAKQYFDGGNDAFALLQAKMAAAQTAEKEGELVEARKLYSDIPPKADDDEVPFYWRAQVLAENCTFELWRKKKAQERATEEAIAEAHRLSARFKELLGKALAAEQLDAAYMASFFRGQIHYGLKEWSAVVEALEPYVDTYSKAKSYRGPALYYYIEACLSEKRPSDAEKAFEKLKKSFEKIPSTQYAALLLTDYFSGLGGLENLRRAAAFVKAYAQHPLSKKELEDPSQLMDIVDTLIRGHEFKAAQEYLATAEKLIQGIRKPPKALRDRVLVRRAQFAFEKNDFATVIDSLRPYITDYDFSGRSGPDDAFIFFMYGVSHVKQNPDAPSPRDMKIAHQALGFSVKLQEEKFGSGDTESHRKEERLFWEWLLEWITVKEWLGDNREYDQFRQILVIIKARKGLPMGGPDLKKKFLVAEKGVQSKFKRIKRKRTRKQGS